MKIAILLAVGMILWLGGSAIRGRYVPDEVGKGIAGLGFLIIAYAFWFISKDWVTKK